MSDKNQAIIDWLLPLPSNDYVKVNLPHGPQDLFILVSHTFMLLLNVKASECY